ncbi:MAG: hypothetical protein Q7T55_22045, partial [Solirubrobacteraceae bacterium]|nr:hypothetical protein [Solirubrobacteraceae bacterium]
WFVILPHLMVFVTSALHASFATKARRLGAAHLANAGPTTGASNTDAADSSRWRAIIFHPAQHVRFFSFHATSGMLFINACVRRSTLFGIAFFGIFAAVAMIGKTGMGQSHRWTVLVFVVLIVMCVQYALHLRPPPQQASDASIAAYLNEWMIDVHAVRAGWSAAHPEFVHYFELQTATDDIMLTMGLWCAVTLHYVGLQAYHAVPGRTEREAAKVKGKLTVTERLKKTEAISLARRHGAMEFFKRLLPLPEGRRDFTRSSSMSIGDAVQLIAYKRSPLLVLVAMFLHSLYDGTTDLSVFKILSLLLVLAFLQNVHRLPWRGNCWWRYLAAFHGVWFGLRLVLFIPGIVRTQWMLCGFQVLGVLPHRNLVNDASSMLSITSGTHCPGAP